MLDRILDNSIIVSINDESFRVKAKRKAGRLATSGKIAASSVNVLVQPQDLSGQSFENHREIEVGTHVRCKRGEECENTGRRIGLGCCLH